MSLGLSISCFADKSKLSYRDLFEDFVLLQEERQELLERVFSMESKLCDQQKIVSEQVKIINYRILHTHVDYHCYKTLRQFFLHAMFLHAMFFLALGTPCIQAAEPS